MLKAVLFDMDGVIVNTEPLHREAYYKMFEEVGVSVPDDLYETYTGRATLPICEDLCRRFELAEKPKTLMNIKRRHFKNLFDTSDSLTLIDGVLDLIQDYHRNELTLVLASSASMLNINRVFERFDLDRYFKGKISGADLEASKPHPEIFIRAAEIAGSPKKNCMVIEDSTNGIKAAHAAGIFCVAFQNPHSVGQDYSKADRLISDFSEISYSKVIEDFSNS